MKTILNIWTVFVITCVVCLLGFGIYYFVDYTKHENDKVNSFVQCTIGDNVLLKDSTPVLIVGQMGYSYEVKTKENYVFCVSAQSILTKVK